MGEISPNQVIQQLMETGRMTGSWVAALATRVDIQPGVIPTEEGDQCPGCGHLFLAGELGHENLTKGSLTFNDAYSMQGPSYAPMCSACATVFASSFMPAYPGGVACSDGFYPFASNADRGWFLLNPPDGQFVMATRLAKLQHLFWRTPVGLNRDIFPVRVGTHVGTVRRKLLQQVSDLGAEILDAALLHEIESQVGSTNKRGRPRKPVSTAAAHPFARLDRDLESSRHGEIKAMVMRYLDSGKAPREAHLLGELNAVELWALSNIANTKPKDVLTERPAAYQPSLKIVEDSLEA